MRSLYVIVFALLCPAALACGVDSDCMIGDRHYRIAHPENAGNGAIVFAHGYRGSARGIMRNARLRHMVGDMGLAFIALKSLRDDWAIPNAPRDPENDGSVEFEYVAAVLGDAEARFGLNRDRVMMSGFSAGGMMVWEVACKWPDLFAGFAPVAGTFWKAPPATCVAPASVVHIHGTSDRTVPLAGRAIGQTRQGDVLKTLEMYRAFGGYVPVADWQEAGMACTGEANPRGDVLEFCTHTGGHSFRRSYLRYAWDRLTAAGRL